MWFLCDALGGVGAVVTLGGLENGLKAKVRAKNSGLLNAVSARKQTLLEGQAAAGDVERPC